MYKSNKDTDAGACPSLKRTTGMRKLIEELGEAGRLLAAEGLRASSKGVRLNFSGGERTVTHGLFTGSK